MSDHTEDNKSDAVVNTATDTLSNKPMSTQSANTPPISGSTIDDVRPWRLPFWTDPPVHVVEREEKEDAKVNNGPVPVSGYPTAEELEIIRREAYNDGLEQGRVEGRQQGTKDGYAEGLEQGKSEGHKEGFALGKQEGINAGFSEGRAKGEAEIVAEATRLKSVVALLQASLRERDSQLPDVVILLLTRLAEQVLKHELSDGAQAIQMYVDEAIAALPDGEILAKVYVAPADAELLAPFVDGVKLHIDKTLASGDCRVESQTSLVEYATSEHLEQAILAIAERLLTTSDGFPDSNEVEQEVDNQVREFSENMTDSNDEPDYEQKSDIALNDLETNPDSAPEPEVEQEQDPLKLNNDTLNSDTFSNTTTNDDNNEGDGDEPE